MSWNSDFTIGTISGQITPQIPISNTFDFVVEAQCECRQGDKFECSLPVSITPICCKEAYLDGKEVCANDASFQIDVTFGGSVTSVLQVDWYLSYAPCNLSLIHI